jgi:SAM-dependent methyltransferase
MESTAIIAAIMQRHGAKCSVEEFHNAVNVTFHEFESEVYDSEHKCMWESLPRQFALLIDDWLAGLPQVPRDIRLLDIGCGTGLATDSIVKTRVGKNLQSISLLDTSPAMLRRASERGAQWPKTPSIHQGLLDSLEGQSRFDLIITCSVLHHVPDVPAFLRDVRRLQAPNGVFLHLQDPNGDYLNDPELASRTAEFAKQRTPEWMRRIAPRRIMRRLVREVTGKQPDDYVSKTNRKLLENGVVESSLTVRELYEITDIHVLDGEGIPVSRMRTWMPDYDLISTRSYGFWGELWSDLPPGLRTREEELISSRAPNGQYVGGIWKLRSSPPLDGRAQEV